MTHTFGAVERPRSRSQIWLITFTDLISLLLTFFVMLFSMSSLKTESWQDVAMSLAERLNPIRGIDREIARQPLALPNVRQRDGADLDYLAAVLEEKLASVPNLNGSVVQRLDDRLVLSLPVDLLFAPRSTAVSDDGKGAIHALAAALGQVRNRIDIVGHSDPRPIEMEYPSNWELSTVRALAVAAVLRRAGVRRSTRVLGAGDSRFAHLSSALTEMRRLEIARRVDLIFRAAEDS